MTALVGESGSGKSTVLALLQRHFDPAHGRITVGGVDLRDLDPAAWRSSLGIVAQDPVLFEGTVRDNVAYGRNAPATDRKL